MKREVQPTKIQLGHLVDGAGNELPFVSKKGMSKAIEHLREDVRNWLDVLHQSMVSALEQKADHAEVLASMSESPRREAATMGLSPSETLALFSKRKLTGKCASCDAPFNLNEELVKRPTMVGAPGQFPLRASHGAMNSIRQPDPYRGSSPPPGTQNRLPKIQDSRAGKDFPKGKVLKNSSSVPALSSARQMDNAMTVATNKLSPRTLNPP